MVNDESKSDDKCPECGGELVPGYGLAGGGCGSYEMCLDCYYFFKHIPSLESQGAPDEANQMNDESKPGELTINAIISIRRCSSGRYFGSARWKEGNLLVRATASSRERLECLLTDKIIRKVGGQRE